LNKGVFWLWGFDWSLPSQPLIIFLKRVF